MKKNWFMIAAFVVLALGMSFAQQPAAQQPSTASPSSDQQTSASQPSAQQTDVGKPTDTDETLFKGCVGGTKDNYTLTDDKGETFRLHSDKDINEHVGSMVEIKGTLQKEGADSQKASASGAAPQKEIDVADIKTISKSCSADTSSK